MTNLADTDHGRWEDRAACRHTDPHTHKQFFLPDPADNWADRYLRGAARIHHQRQAAADALNLCKTCPVKAQCLYTHWNDPHMIAGGTVPAERDRRNRPPAPRRR